MYRRGKKAERKKQNPAFLSPVGKMRKSTEKGSEEETSRPPWQRLNGGGSHPGRCPVLTPDKCVTMQAQFNRARGGSGVVISCKAPRSAAGPQAALLSN